MPVEGIDRLKRRLTASGQTLERVVEEAMFNGADEVVSMARLMVPKDSGKLANSITRSGMLKTPKGNAKIEISAGDASTIVGTRVKFQLAQIVELGAVGHPAQPFLRPALRLKSRAIRTKIRAAMRAAIKVANGTNTASGT